MDQVNAVITGCKSALEEEGFNPGEIDKGIDLCLEQLDRTLEEEQGTDGGSGRTRSAGTRLPLQGLCTRAKILCDPKEPFRYYDFYLYLRNT